MNNATLSLPDIQKAASEALSSARSATDSRRTELLRDTARYFIDAREHFFTREGEPGWLGRTHAYRTWVREVMSSANIPGDEVTSLQAAIRYHSGNVLRDRLDGDTIDDLGLRKESPRERSVEKRERTSGTLNLFGGGHELVDAEEILQACRLMEAALSRVNVSALSPKKRREARAALARVAEKAAGLAGGASPS
ncbi:hypothetical protein SEA_SNEK_26 [Arthrobacter phage Snek]